jgi:hypothetical protein
VGSEVRGERGRGEKKCAGFGCGEGRSGRGYRFEWAAERD